MKIVHQNTIHLESQLQKSPYLLKVWKLKWWARWGSNPRPRDYESPALTAELQARES